MISHRYHSVYGRRLFECSRRFSTSTRPTKNASRSDVSQNAPYSGDRRATVRASPSAAHRLVVAHRAASAPHKARHRSPFSLTCARPHHQTRRFWPTRSIKPVERSRTFGPAATGGYKYRPPSWVVRHFTARCQTRSTLIACDSTCDQHCLPVAACSFFVSILFCDHQ